VRQLESTIDNIVFSQLDLSAPLPSKFSNCTDSLSSLHAVEHIGLGRYGDKVDYEGHIKAINNLAKMLRPAGRLYLSVPIGDQRVEFNAHRVFSVNYLVQLLNKNGLKIQKTILINDAGEFIGEVAIENGLLDNFKCNYGCMIVECTK